MTDIKSGLFNLNRQRKRYIVLTVIMAVTTLAFVVSGILKEKPKAVIIDQLGQTYPNPSLIRSITGKFVQAGYKVDYVRPEEVTVNFYRSLPAKGYKYIILRAHLNMFRNDPVPYFREELALSTNELYTKSKYVFEQMKGKVVCLIFNSPHLGTKYFGVSSRFVRFNMEGNFNGSTVIMMGCNGLTFPLMAEAILLKGANTVIGWDNTVSLRHTDSSVEPLLENLLNRQMNPQHSVEKVMAEIGEDPEYGSKLLVYK